MALSHRTPSPSMHSTAAFMVTGLILMLVSGCSTVRFNERETLARPDMQFDATPLQAELEGHIYSSREGASGGFSTSGGGGCGCF